MIDSTGKSVGDYVLERELGRGQFGVVFRCRHRPSNEIYALKMILKQMITTPNQKANLKTEVTIMHQVRHPNVMHLYDFIESKNAYYLIIDFCDGGDLYTFIRKQPRGYLEEPEAISLFGQIRDGFAELRRQKVMHRDIKSENFFFKNGKILIGDFGLAKQGKDTAISLVGSPELMAPEVLRGDIQDEVTYDSKADLWSLGCLFFEMLFGDAPFKWSSTYKMLSEINLYSGKNLRVPRQVSAEAKDLLMGLLTENASQRLDWNAFFSHPIFSSAQPLRGNQPSQPPASPQLTFGKTIAIEDSPAQIFGAQGKVFKKYEHETAKLAFIASAAVKLDRFAANPALSDWRQRLAELCLLVGKKSLCLYQKFILFIEQKENILQDSQTEFEAFLRSTERSLLISRLNREYRSKDGEIWRISQKFIQEAGLIRHKDLIPEPDQLSVIDSALRSEYSSFIINSRTKLRNQNEESRSLIIALTYALVSLEIDRHMPLTLEDGSPFDWSSFANDFEAKAVSMPII